MNKTSITLTLNDIVCLSEKRRTILLLLGKKKYGAEELTEKMDMTAHSLAPQLKTLRDEGLIFLNDGVYELTEIGCILVKNMYPLFETIQILEKNQKYWFDRDLSAIPPELSERIREIENYQLLEYNISDYMLDIPAEYKEKFEKSKNAMCLLHYIIRFIPKCNLKWRKPARK
jgi:Predicted transcriptional regulator